MGGNWFSIPRMFKNPVSIRNILFSIHVVRIWIKTAISYLEKYALIGLLKVIGIEIFLYDACGLFIPNFLFILVYKLFLHINIEDLILNRGVS